MMLAFEVAGAAGVDVADSVGSLLAGVSVVDLTGGGLEFADVVGSEEVDDVSEVDPVEPEGDNELEVDELVEGTVELELRTGFGLM